MNRRCVHCNAVFTPEKLEYVCPACLAKAVAQAAEIETQARTVACTACGVPAGKPCLTGSRGERSAHVPRVKLASKLAKKKEVAR